MVIVRIVGLGILLAIALFIATPSKPLSTRLDCLGPSIDEIGACRRDGSCLVKANNETYRAFDPKIGHRLCIQ